MGPSPAFDSVLVISFGGPQGPDDIRPFLANVLRGRTLTCWPSIAIDVKNAGGLYVDKPVVEDGNLITSRKPDDVPVFNEAIIRALAKVHA